MNDLMWYLTRATGIVATVLALASLCWGFLFSARETGRRLRPAWWLDLHNWLGGLALIFTVIHIGTALLDSDLGVGIVSALVPGAGSDNRWALAWGVIAFYLFAVAVLTSWPKRRFARRTWRILHLGSVAGVALAMLHGQQMGTESGTVAFRIGLLLLFGFGTFTLSTRLLGVATKSRNRR